VGIKASFSLLIATTRKGHGKSSSLKSLIFDPARGDFSGRSKPRRSMLPSAKSPTSLVPGEHIAFTIACAATSSGFIISSILKCSKPDAPSSRLNAVS